MSTRNQSSRQTTRQCEQCGRTFVQVGNRRTRHCGPTCRNRAWRKTQKLAAKRKRKR